MSRGSTRSADCLCLCPPFTSRLKFSDRSFRNAAPHLWNNLPPSLRSYSSCNYTSSDSLSYPQLAFSRLQFLSRLKILPNLASSTSPEPVFLSTRQWHHPWLDWAPGIHLFYRFYWRCENFCTYILTYSLTSHTRSHVCTSKQSRGQTHTYTNTHTHTHTRTSTHIHHIHANKVNTNTYTHANKKTHNDIYTYIHIHTHVHTHTHTHTHIFLLFSCNSPIFDILFTKLLCLCCLHCKS